MSQKLLFQSFLSLFMLLLLVSSCQKESQDPLSTKAEILAFSIKDVETQPAIFSADSQSIRGFVSSQADITQLKIQLQVSAKATIKLDDQKFDPETTAVDFSSSREFQIVSESGKEKIWTIRVIQAKLLLTGTKIDSFELPDQVGASNIDSTNALIELELHYAADISKQIASFSSSPGSQVFINGVLQESGVTSNDFSSDVIYTVQAEDPAISRNWTVRVTQQPTPEFIVSTLVEDFPGNDGLSVDPEGNIYVNNNGLINQWNGNTVYKVTPEGNWHLYASGLQPFPVGSQFDLNGDLIVSGWQPPGLLIRISKQDSSRTDIFSGLLQPSGVEVDNDGNIYVMEPPNNKMYKLDTKGNMTVFASGPPFNNGAGITFIKSTGEFFVTNWVSNTIVKVSPTGTVSPFVTLPASNVGPITNYGDWLYCSSYYSHKIFKVNRLTAEIKLIAGTGAAGHKDGDGAQATFRSPLGVGLSPDGKRIYVAEISPSGKGRLRVIDQN